MESNHSASPKLAHKVAKFKDYVLTGTRLPHGTTLYAAYVISGEKDHGKSCLGRVRFEFFDNRATAVIRLFMKDNWPFTSDSLDKISDLKFGVPVMPVDNEHFATVRRTIR